MELLSVWNGIPFLRSSLGLIPTSFEIGSSAFQNDFRISIQKNWLIKLLPTFFVFGVEKPKLANPCACFLAVTFSLTYFWTSQIEPVWCLLSRYGGLTTFFSHFLKIQKIIRPSLFFLQALFEDQWNQVGYLFLCFDCYLCLWECLCLFVSSPVWSDRITQPPQLATAARPGRLFVRIVKSAFQV